MFLSYVPGVGTQIWSTDGSVATSITSIGGLNTLSAVAAGSRLYFYTGVGPDSIMFYVSDGTAAGTHSVTTTPSWVNFVAGTSDGKLFYVTNNADDSGQLLWSSDGTPREPFRLDSSAPIPTRNSTKCPSTPWAPVSSLRLLKPRRL